MGNTFDVLIRDIIVGERFRKDYGEEDDWTQFKANLSSRGLIQPISLDRNNNLLAGGRRLRAATELGWARIFAHYMDDIDNVSAREIELEENFFRKDLTIHERDDLIAEIDRLKKAKYAGQMKYANPDTTSSSDGVTSERLVPAWTQNDTAALTGLHPSTVSRAIAMSDARVIMPELNDEETHSQMLKKIDRRIEEIDREIEFRRLKSSGGLDRSGRVLLGDCCELLEDIPDGTVDCVIIDPPYGVLEPGSIGRYESGVHFDDDPVAAMSLLRRAAKEIQRVAKHDAHIYVFFGIKRFIETKGIFDHLNFDVDPIPLIWVKTTGSVVDWDYRFSNFYEPILFISNRTRRLSRKSSNVFHHDSVPSTKRANVAEKPVSLLRELLELSTRPGDLVLDCFAGSGSTGVAAKQLGRRYLLIEKDEQQWKEAQNRLSACSTGSPSSASISVSSSTEDGPTTTLPDETSSN